MDEYRLWDYNPSILAAAVGTGVCGFLTLIHAFKLARHRTWFCMPFIIGGLFETIGYAARVGAHDNTGSITPYIVQSLLILLAPIFFAASIYAILGRLIRHVGGDNMAIVHPSIMTRFFVFGDVLCFLIQSGGGGILSQAKTHSSMNLGKNMVLVGLGLQIYIFCFFVKIAATFQRGLQKHPTDSVMDAKFPWRRYMILLYVVCACVGIRSAYRVVEYAMGKSGRMDFSLFHEWPLYVGDFALMAITLTVCLAWYDPEARPRSQSMDRVEMGLL